MRGARTSAPSTVKSYGKPAAAVSPSSFVNARGRNATTPAAAMATPPRSARSGAAAGESVTAPLAPSQRRARIDRPTPSFAAMAAASPGGSGRTGSGRSATARAAAEARIRAVRSVFSNLRRLFCRSSSSSSERVFSAASSSSASSRRRSRATKNPPVSWSCGRNRAHRSRRRLFVFARGGGHIVGAAHGMPAATASSCVAYHRRVTSSSESESSESSPLSSPSSRESSDPSPFRSSALSLSLGVAKGRLRAAASDPSATCSPTRQSETPGLCLSPQPVFDPRGSRTSSKRSPPGPSSTAATTASSSTGFRLHVEYSKNPPGRTSAAAFRATATCVACRALPSPGCHRFKTSGSLRSVPSPEHGTSASTASYPRVTESETTLSPSLFRSLNTGTGTSCPMAQVTTRLAVSFAARLCLATASRSVSTRRGFPSFATTRPCSGPPVGETRSRSCMVLFPGAAHTSSTRSPAFRRGESASTGSIDTASCLAQTPAPTPSATASATSGCSFLWCPACLASATASTARQPSPGGIHGMGAMRPFSCRGARRRAANSRASGRETCTRNVMGKDVANAARVSANSRGGASLCAR